MKRHLRIIMIGVLIGVLLLSSISFAADSNMTNSYGTQKISQIFAFGDSFSDNGAANAISTEIMNDPNRSEKAYIKPADPSSNLYWENRYSNGITAVEVLSENLEVKLTNYAVGGATSGDENYSAWMDMKQKTGLLGQIKEYEKSLNGEKADPDALYFIWASANDYYLFMDYELPGKIETVANQCVDNISTAVYRLARMGAKKFFVVNSVDLSTLPYEIIYERTEAAKKFSLFMNKRLPYSMKYIENKVNVSIALFDFPAVFNKIAYNTEKYGIVELTKPCERTWPEIQPAADNPDQYFFWDEYHPTRAAHKIVGDEMYQLVGKYMK